MQYIYTHIHYTLYIYIYITTRTVNINPLGTTNMLRFQLSMKMRQLRADDLMIKREGIGSLTVSEIQTACLERGMRSMGVTIDRLRSQMVHIYIHT